MTDPLTPAGDTRCGFVALLGAPNAGKSTLLNALVGARVAIVTHKVQTTRLPLRGISTHDDAQLVFIDTPGIFQPKRRLDRAMTAAAWQSGEDADILLHVVDAGAEVRLNQGANTKPADPKMRADRERVEAGLKQAKRKAILVLNKVDSVKKEELLPVIEQIYDEEIYDEVQMLSAQSGSGVEDLKAILAGRVPPGPWHFPEDQIADANMRLLAAEITREKLMLRVHDELPYVSHVETETFKTLKDGSARIEQTIYVERPSQRAIILGDKGQTIKTIGSQARKDIAELLGTPAHVFLTVKVKDWQDDRGLYARLGLDYSA